MKRKTIIAFFACATIIMCSSCYKTGEIIYQPTCKPDSISVSKPLYNFLNFYDFALLKSFQGPLTYNFGHLDRTDCYQNGTRIRIIQFVYSSIDPGSNLYLIDDYVVNPGVNLAAWYTFSFPSGTMNSLSSTAQVQLTIVDDKNNITVTGPVWTYNFNAQFQLESIFQGVVKLEQLTYDFAGNCLSDSVYNQSGQLTDYYIYTSYDNGINPARSDRSLQLLFHMYSKNNPTNSVHYLKGVGGDPNGFAIDLSSSGSYTYNLYGYPTTYAGDFFAQYDCHIPTAPMPLPGPLK
jgi:hypothetical protein